MLRILFGLLPGIVSARYAPVPFSWLMVFLFWLIALLLCYPLVPWSLRLRFPHVRSLLFLLLLFFFGQVLFQHQDPRRADDFFVHHATGGDTLLVDITEWPNETNHSRFYRAKLIGQSRNGQLQPASGYLSLQVDRQLCSQGFRPGDRLLMTGSLKPIRESGNPGAFRRTDYLQRRQIYHQWRIGPLDRIQYIGHNRQLVSETIHDLREHVLGVLRTHIDSADSRRGIAEALLIGYREDLDEEVLQSYTDTGVVHIIAISGLHLGLIYLTLKTLFAFIPLLRRLRWLNAVLLLVALWTFTLITGASASVLRSAVMFSCLLAGDCLGRKSGSANALAGSAVLLLVSDPWLAWDIGAQLSYAAITGIMALQKPLRQRMPEGGRWIRQVYDMSSVTLAAQLMTLPLCLYYFHQFPVYFLPANLILVPLSTLVLFLEIGLLCFTPVLSAAEVFGGIISVLLGWMNGIAQFFQQLPLSVIERIPFGGSECLMSFLVLFYLSRFAHFPNPSLLSALGICGTSLCLIHSYHRVALLHRHQVVVYQTPRRFIMDVIEGYRVTSFFTDSLPADVRTGKILHQARNHLMLHPGTEEGLTRSGAVSIRLSGLHILLAQGPCPFPDSLSAPRTDWLICSENALDDLDRWIRAVQPVLLIFDATHRLWKIEEWKKRHEKLHLRSYSIPHEGAFVSRLR